MRMRTKIKWTSSKANTKTSPKTNPKTMNDYYLIAPQYHTAYIYKIHSTSFFFLLRSHQRIIFLSKRSNRAFQSQILNHNFFYNLSPVLFLHFSQLDDIFLHVVHTLAFLHCGVSFCQFSGEGHYGFVFLFQGLGEGLDFLAGLVYCDFQANYFHLYFCYICTSDSSRRLKRSSFPREDILTLSKSTVCLTFFLAS